MASKFSTRKKLIIIGTATAIVIVALVLPFILGGEKYEMTALERLPDREIPTQIYIWLESQGEGYNAYYSDGFIYLAGKLGQRPTGGYAVILGDAELETEQVTVTVEHRAPKPWDMVTQVITYPRTVVKLSCSGNPPVAALFLSKAGSVLAKVGVINLDTPD